MRVLTRYLCRRRSAESSVVDVPESPPGPDAHYFAAADDAPAIAVMEAGGPTEAGLDVISRGPGASPARRAGPHPAKPGLSIGAG